jgi:hypothetical protein
LIPTLAFDFQICGSDVQVLDSSSSFALVFLGGLEGIAL